MNFFQWPQNAVFTAHRVLISMEGKGSDTASVCLNRIAISVLFCKVCYFQNLTNHDSASMLTVTSHGHKSVWSKMHCAATTYNLPLASDDFFLFIIALAWTRVPVKRKGTKNNNDGKSRLKRPTCSQQCYVHWQRVWRCKGITLKAVHSKHRSQNPHGWKFTNS